MNEYQQIIGKSIEELSMFLDGSLDDMYIYSAPKVREESLSYQPSILDVKSSISQIKKYWVRDNNEIIKDVNLAFKQHGIIIEG